MRSFYSGLFLALALAARGGAQIVLDPSPARVIGHPAVTPAEQLTITNVNPNFGANGGMYEPQGVAVDTSGSSPILYVADFGNNRVLAWKNATSSTLKNLQPPDLIIGQPNAYTSFPTSNGGLNHPTALLVDGKGNLYVADCGNNRVLRYPAPFASSSSGKPDIVLGQPDPFTSRSPNQGSSPKATTLYLSTGSTTFLSALAMDGNGNLFVADAGNNRVLRYPAASLTSGALDPAADVVVGQTSKTTVINPSGVLDRNILYAPSGLAFDSEGHLFVSDGLNRLVVFPAQVSSAGTGDGVAAVRLAGYVKPTPPTATASTLSNPEGLVMINDGPAVMDANNNRMLIFDAFSSQDWTTTDTTLAVPAPVATAALGQGSSLTAFSSTLANAGNAQPCISPCSAGSQVPTFWGPAAGAVAGTDLFVVDSGNNRVLVYPNAGQTAVASVVLGQSGFMYNSPNSIQGKEFYFGSPYSASDAGIVVDTNSNPPHLYVSDPGNNRVLGFADARTVTAGVKADLVIGEPDMFTSVCNYGGVENPPGLLLARQPTQTSLCYPTGLAVDPSGNLFVADSSNGRVLRFPAPFDSQNSAQQADLVLGQSGFTGVSNPQASQSVTVFPYGLVYDAARGLLVSDESANRVLLFPVDSPTNGEAATKVMGQSNFTSTNNSALSAPHHIGEDTIGQVYVADSGHNQIAIFAIPAGTSTNQPVNTLYALATGGGLSNPQGIWVNQNTVAGYHNDIWVADNNGISRFPTPNPLGTGNQATLTIPAAEITGGQSLNCNVSSYCVYPALALTQDSWGDLYVADASNRVGMHYPALAAENGASFVCAMGCNLGGLADPQYYLAPGAFASLFPFGGVSFASSTTVNSQLPVPTTLGGVQVVVNGTPSPITTVAAGQINFVVPFEAPTSGTAGVTVVNAATQQILGSGVMSMNEGAPGFFTKNQNGIGQIAALNCNTSPCDNTVNGTANPVQPGKVIQLFLTGQGLVPNAPPDGVGASGAVPTSSQPAVYIGGSLGTLLYSGLAPGYPGLWQINVQLPSASNMKNLPGFAAGVFPVLVQYQGLTSNSAANNSNPSYATTIAVNAPQ